MKALLFLLLMSMLFLLVLELLLMSMLFFLVLEMLFLVIILNFSSII